MFDAIKKIYDCQFLNAFSSLALAEDNNPSQGPSGTESYTLEDIYKRLETGEEGNQTPFTGPGGQPEQQFGYTLNEIMEVAPKVEEKDAAGPEDVAKGKVYWGLKYGEWGRQEGQLEKGGGVVECSTGEDRFTDNGDKTVTDNCTQLVWLKNAGCFKDSRGKVAEIAWNKYWPKDLKNGQPGKGGMPKLMEGYSDCILKGKANAKENWRLPSLKELQSLIDFSQDNPALPQNHPFDSVQTGHYWSSTKLAYGTGYAWFVLLSYGYVGTYRKSGTGYVWPVRSRQDD